MRPRPLARRSGVALLGAVGALALAEIAVRVVDPAPSFRARAQAAYACDRHHPLRGWTGRPDLDEAFVRPDFAIRVRTNAAGFRTRALEPVDEAVRHVVVLGDSFAWGWGVERDERFDTVLERASDGGVVCTNLAQPGYGTDQQLLTLREHGAALQPDVVLVLFSHNDLKNVAAAQQYGKPKPRFVLDPDGGLELTRVPVPNDPEAWRERRAQALQLEVELGPVRRWLERSQLFNWIAARRMEPTDGAERRAASDRQVLERGRALAAALLRAIDRECEGLGARLVVAWNPRRPEVEGRVDGGWQEELEQGLEGVETVDLGDVLAACGGRLYFREDPHWTARAHGCVGRALAERWGE